MRVRDVFGNLPTLETERLWLRKLRPDDKTAIFAYASDPQVTEHTHWYTHEKLIESMVFINSVMQDYDMGDVAPWAIVHKADRKLIGTGGFNQWNTRQKRAEIGYAIARPYWGQGYTTEAVKAMIAFGFRRMQLCRIQTRCLTANVASARVMEKAGMHFEGVLRQYAQVKGKQVDLKLYAIVKADFE